MAKNSTMYIGSFNQDDEVHTTNVDLMNIPYDKFSAENPLRISADVDMGKGKKAPLPDFTNVIINGTFDCSDFTITSNTVLPQGITELICMHSVSDLGVLIGKMPESVQKIVVRTAVLNAIAKEQDDKLDIAQQFIAMYPNIVVTDDKKLNLAEIIKQKTEPVIEQNTDKTPKAEPEKAQLKIKTDDWLSTDEITDMCMKDVALIIMPAEQIKRKVRTAKSRAPYIGITVQKMERVTDGATVDCVHYNDIPKIVQFIASETHAKDIPTTAEPTKRAKPIKEQPKETVQQEPKFFVGTKEVKPVTITKYIKNNIWAKILNHCGNNTAKLLGFLRDIQVINIQPTDTKGKQVCYIQDGEIKTSLTVKFKAARRLTQSFATLDDRYRIIWAMKQDTFIAIDFFSEHERKQKTKYKQSIREKDDSQLTTEDTVSVDEKIAELEQKIASKAQPAPDITPVAQPEPVVQPEPVAQPEPVVQKEPTVTEPAQQAQSMPIFTEIDSMHTKLEFLLNQAHIEYQETLKLMPTADTDRAIELTNRIQDTLSRKKSFEVAIKKLDDVKKTIEIISQLLPKQLQR